MFLDPLRGQFERQMSLKTNDFSPLYTEADIRQYTRSRDSFSHTQAQQQAFVADLQQMLPVPACMHLNGGHRLRMWHNQPTS